MSWINEDLVKVVGATILTSWTPAILLLVALLRHYLGSWVSRFEGKPHNILQLLGLNTLDHIALTSGALAVAFFATPAINVDRILSDSGTGMSIARQYVVPHTLYFESYRRPTSSVRYHHISGMV